ncbi:MAG: Ig-like domain-containing protein [Bacteroidaceae bacterium]|nr:Ig-like domain-containing protein [Bacteroidaceae bacterium]
MEGDKNAATLSSSGRLTGNAKGNVRVIVTTANGYSDYCDVEIYKPEPSSISFVSKDQNITMPVGDSRTLSYTVSPDNAIYTVTWKSDKEDIVAVNQSGRIEARLPGTAHITVTTDNGKTATNTVTVPPQPTAISVIPKELELLMGRTKQLSYSLSPDNAMAHAVTWASSDNTIAYVTSSGLVEARRPGTVTITATTDNGKVGKCQLTVPVPLFQLFVWMKNGEKTGYLSTDKPQFRLDGDIVKFTTDNLSLDIHKDSLDKFTLEQVLPEHPQDIAMADYLKVGLGQSKQLLYELTPADAETQITWLNSNPEVVSVSPGGLVTGLQVGTAVLKVQTSNGLRATCIVTVPEPAYRFYVWLRDGDVESYALEEKPLVTMGAELFTLTTTTTTVGYAAKDVLKFTLEDSAVRAVDGDINHDDQFTLDDITTLIAVYLGDLEAVKYDADIDNDGKVSVDDITKLINLYLKK